MTLLRRGLTLIGCLALTACGGDGPHAPLPAAMPVRVGTQLAADQTVTRALNSMPRTLDPALLTDIEGQQLADDLFEGLTTIGPDGLPAPGVAASWEVSPDGRSWVFHLRPEARWSNGEPVTAADFLYSWRREVDPKTGAEYSQALAPIVGAMAIATGHAALDTLGVEAPDAHTLHVTLNAPTPYLLALLADSFMQPVPRAAIEAYGDDWTSPGHLVSNGPFVLSELVVGDRITLARNPQYWAAAGVHPTQVIYYPLDQIVQVSRFLSNGIQFSSMFPSNEYQYLKSQLGDQVCIGAYLGVTQLVVNMLHGPFAANRDLRLALSMALDRRVLAEKVRQGVQVPAFSLVPPLADYTQQVPDWASWSDERRHAEARRRYAAAGYSAAHPLEVQLVYPTDEGNRDLYDAVTAMWRTNLGADVQPYNEEFRVQVQNLRLHKPELFQSSWIGDYPDPFTFLQLFQTGFDQNFGGYADAEFDRLLAAANQQPDVGRRYAYFEQAEARLNDQAPYIPMFYYTSRHLIKPYLKGWKLNLLDRLPSRYMYVLEHGAG